VRKSFFTRSSRKFHEKFSVNKHIATLENHENYGVRALDKLLMNFLKLFRFAITITQHFEHLFKRFCVMFTMNHFTIIQFLHAKTLLEWLKCFSIKLISHQLQYILCLIHRFLVEIRLKTVCLNREIVLNFAKVESTSNTQGFTTFSSRDGSLRDLKTFAKVSCRSCDKH
jgi:hypothetical protein